MQRVEYMASRIIERFDPAGGRTYVGEINNAHAAGRARRGASMILTCLTSRDSARLSFADYEAVKGDSGLPTWVGLR